MSSKVKVAVRVRPFNRREMELGAKVVVDMIEEQTILLSLRGDKKMNKTFTFDHSFWSIDENSKKFAGQEKVYGCLGKDLLQNAFEGYNACIFAYGQTGSGKTYTMMGATGQKGLIPRLCDELFDRINKNDDQNVTYRVEVSYIEIYNEKVRDLLCPRGGLASLRVREHKVLGPYVEGLTKLVVSSFADIEALIIEGNKSRTVAATNMNAESSRSHAVFNIVLARSEYDSVTETVGEKVSKVSLVDLAGSERVSKTGAEGDRLKEGSNINRSLTTLGQVISSLADQSSGINYMTADQGTVDHVQVESAGKQKKGAFVPYRDSVLTWLLKDNLGGNSRTVMVATVSPSSDNYEETLSTLRYADRAKRIVNHAVINEDPNARIIRELREEVEMLKALLKEKIALKPTGTKETVEIEEMLSENEKLMKECTMSWEQKEKQTEQIMHERHKALEEMGISVQSSGIAVEKGKFYLVNLNADPSMNELLVYYLKDHTLVGRPDAPHTPGIQLSGLGILPEHASLDIEENEVFITPFPHANTCVNGKVVQEKTILRHGDRILWGNNHFFRINCPRPPGSENQSEQNQPEQPSDFQFAYNEIMMNELQAGPLHDAMNTLEEQYKADKEGALEKQRQMYEEKIEELRNQMTPVSRSPYMERTPSWSSFSSGYGSRMSCLDDNFGRDLPYQTVQKPLVLKEEVVKANALVREANQFSEEMGKDTEFAVTLQIPTSSLSYGRPRSGFSSEVAIVVKHKNKGTQIWSLEKLSNKIFDMRDLYQQCVEENVPFADKDPDSDLFFEVECHTLIGVANVFLECLFHDVNLEYAAPIISQQGEVCGRLKVEISRLADKDDSDSDSSNSGSESPEDYELEDDEETLAPGSQMSVEVKVIEAIDLPPALCHYVFCQYRFWDEHDTVVVPPVNASISHPGPKTNTMIFDHNKSFTISISEDFLEYASEGSLAIEVWGNRSQGFDSSNKTNWNIDTPTQPLQERWSELVRKMELWVEIHELNDQGFYSPVELQTRMESGTGGIFQLRQGHSRRVVARVNTVPKSGQLPVVCNSISSVYIGSISSRSKSQQMLDSYQEKDISILREKWSNSLMKRREYLDDQIQSLINKPDKSSIDKERESWLIDQWVSLTEERNAVLVPLAGSGIPGAPQMNGYVMQELEEHCPVIFLDLNETADQCEMRIVQLLNTTSVSSVSATEDMVSGCVDEARPAGVDTTLPFENPDSMVEMPIIKYDQKQVSATASWDSSIHDSIYLNRLTSANERVYLIVKVIVRLTSPLSMDLVLRKRICVRIYKKQSWKDTLMKKINKEQRTRCGVMYELVSHIPKQPGEETEERASLAQMAALAVGQGEEEDETVLEKYTKEISNVESLLQLDKLRQEVVVKEKLAAIGKPLRKFASTPNLAASSHDVMFGGSGRFDSPESRQLWEARNFGRSDYNFTNSGSFTENRQKESLPIPAKENRAKESEWKEKEKDELFLDLSQLVSPPRNPVRQNSTAGTPNSRPNSILLETLVEDDSSSPSPSPRLKVSNVNFDFKPVDIPKLDLGDDNDDDEAGRKRDQSSESERSYENLPTPTAFDELKDEETRERQLITPPVPVSLSEQSSLLEISGEIAAGRDSGAATPTPEAAIAGQTSGSVQSQNDLPLPSTEPIRDTSEQPNDNVLISPELHNSSVDSQKDTSYEGTNQTENNPDTSNQLEKTNLSGHQSEISAFGSQEDFDTGFDVQEWEEDEISSELKLGTLVSIGDSKTGFIRFIGRTDFAPGPWIGIELDMPKGKNDGSVNGVRYFACKPRYGSFVRPDKVTPLNSRTPPTRRDQGRSGSRRNLSSRNDSPSRNAVVMRAQAGANRRKNEWKRRSNILF